MCLVGFNLNNNRKLGLYKHSFIINPFYLAGNVDEVKRKALIRRGQNQRMNQIVSPVLSWIIRLFFSCAQMSEKANSLGNESNQRDMYASSKCSKSFPSFYQYIVHTSSCGSNSPKVKKFVHCVLKLVYQLIDKRIYEEKGCY